MTEMDLELLISKSFFEKSLCKLAQDECYQWRVSLVRTGAALISSYFPEEETGIAALTITNFLSLRLRNWYIPRRYLKLLKKIFPIIKANHPLHPLPLLPYSTNTIKGPWKLVPYQQQFSFVV